MGNYLTAKKAIFFLPALVLLGLLLVAPDALAADKYWIGTGGDSFNDNAKWSTTTGGSNDTTAPGTGDVAIFDSNGNTNVALDSTVDVSGIDIKSGYTATLTQSSGVTVTVGSGNYVQADGTFTGSDATIDLNGTFTQSGGVFTSTSATFYMGGNVTISGGTFNHNSGTIEVDRNPGGHNVRTIDVNTSLTVNNYTSNIGGGFDYTLASGDTLIIEDTYTGTSGGVDTGTLEFQGDVTISSSGQASALVTFSGTNNQTVDLTGATDRIDGNVTINKASGIVRLDSDMTLNGSLQTFTLTSGELDTNTNDFAASQGLSTLSGGTFTGSTGSHTFKGLTVSGATYTDGTTVDNNGALTFSSGSITAATGTWYQGGAITYSNGTFAHNSGTWELDGNPGAHTRTYTFSVAGDTFTVNNLVLNIVGGWDTIIASGDTLKAEGTFTTTSGGINTGELEVEGDVTMNTTATSSATLLFSGGNTQSFSGTNTDKWDGDTFVNKSGGAVNLAATMTLNASNQDLTIEEGTFDVSGQTLVVNGSSGTVVVEDGGNFQLEGDETITLNSAITLNSGSTMTYDATSGSRAIADLSYHHLTINGASGTFTVPSLTDSSLGGDLTVTAGRLDLDGNTLTMAGSFSNEDTFVAEGGETFTIGTGSFDTDSGTAKYKGDGSTAYANLNLGDNYYNLEFDNAGNSWTLDAALDVNNNMVITNGVVDTGTSNVTVGGDWTVAGVYQAGSNTTIFDGSSGTQTIVTGGTGANFDFNNVTINNSGTAVQLSTNGMDVDGDLTITAGVLDLNGQSLTAAGTVSNDGTLQLEGGETVTLTMDDDSGTVLYDGTGTYASGLAAGDAYYDLTFNGSGGSWTMDATLDVNDDLTITNGTLATGGNNITLADDWTNNGTFTHGSATVSLDGSGQLLVGDTTFYNLTKSTSSAVTLTLTAGDTFTVSNVLTLQGQSGADLTVVSSSGGSTANLDLNGSETAEYVDVQDIINAGSVTISCSTGCTDSGNNTGWTFSSEAEDNVPIGAAPGITVTSAMLMAPNGAEDLTGGEIFTIVWSVSGNAVSTITLSYTTDYGKTYTEIATGEDNDGAYVWTVPNIDASAVKVYVAGMTSSGGELIGDSSNQQFAITPSTTAETPQVNDDEGTEELDTSTPAATMQRLDGTDIQLYEGNLFRGETLSGVYLVRNGQRYVFPSASVFHSYYPNFDDVVHVKDNYLQELDLGGRVTMAPGKMIKIQSDNRVFQVQSDGSISHIPDEATAIALYGTTWNQQITDISVTFWGDYPVGEALASLE